MKKLYLVLPIILLVYWNCEEPKEEDNTPPTVSISSHSSGQTVNEIVTIIVNTQDNVEVSKVEFYINDSLVITDTESPYQYVWNTTTFNDTSYIIKAISYDNSDNFSESQLIELIVDNTGSYPSPVVLYPIIFQNGSFATTWSQNYDTDFSSYKLYESISEDMSDESMIYETDVRLDTTYVVSDVSEGELKYYQVIAEDIFGLQSFSDIVLANSHIIITFTKTFGGINSDVGNSILQTSDGGYIVVGVTKSFGNGEKDCWVLKTDVYGNEEWNNTYGSDVDDECYCIRETIDGGFIMTGYRGKWPSLAVILIKISALGVEEWNEGFGITYHDVGYSLLQTNDGGYVVSGYNGQQELANLLLFKTDINGNVEWSRTFDGNTWEDGKYIIQTDDGGFIITGRTGVWPELNVLLVKTNSIGIEEWRRSYDYNSHDRGYSVEKTTDGGYSITGYTGDDLFLLKTDEDGIEISHKTFGKSGLNDKGHSIKESSDNGFIITGFTETYGNGLKDVWLIKTDESGNVAWEKTFGGGADDVGNSVLQTIDGGYIITGTTNSFGNGSSDVWLIKTDSEGITVEYP